MEIKLTALLPENIEKTREAMKLLYDETVKFPTDDMWNNHMERKPIKLWFLNFRNMEHYVRNRKKKY